jgi:hypothetical protein
MVPLLLLHRGALPTSRRHLGRVGAQEQITQGAGAPASVGYYLLRDHHDLFVRVLSQ